MEMGDLSEVQFEVSKSNSKVSASRTTMDHVYTNADFRTTYLGQNILDIVQ